LKYKLTSIVNANACEMYVMYINAKKYELKCLK